MLKQHDLNFPFTQNQDKVSWKWSLRGVFIVKSTYDRLTSDDNGESYSRIWKAKFPYKIKIFTWLLENKDILTKDNTVKKNWPGNPTCAFFSQLESLDHMFFQCSVARVTWGFIAFCLGAHEIPNDILSYSGWIRKFLPGETIVYHLIFAAIYWAIWKCRNKACFDSKLIKHPAEITYHSCSFMMYWAGLYPPELQGKILEGVKTLLACVHLAVALCNLTTFQGSDPQ